MTLAPIIVFAYNRPWHLQRTLEALSANELAAESHLFIFIDGPKSGAGAEELARINEVKDVARSKQWCKTVIVTESEKNKGLAGSIISGISLLVDQYGKIIVVEDDVVTSPYFLRFMNESLELFEKEERVLSIGSWNYFTDPEKVKKNFFLHMPDTIAWATWKRAWKLFEPDSRKLHEQLQARGLMNKFNLGGRFNFEKMLLDQAAGKVSSWAIRWTAVAVLNNTLSLYPHTSLSKHIGFGPDSSNCEGDDYNKNLVLASKPLEPEALPLQSSPEAEKAWIYIEKEIKHSGMIIDKKKVLLAKVRLFLSNIKRSFSGK